MECVDVDYIVSFSFLLECTVGESCPMEMEVVPKNAEKRGTP